uniref:Uncharacterized protein n=1 Tax=Tetranychus urticae TaxID=32264 RepID=T1KPQ8_TETUR
MFRSTSTSKESTSTSIPTTPTTTTTTDLTSSSTASQTSRSTSRSTSKPTRTSSTAQSQTQQQTTVRVSVRLHRRSNTWNFSSSSAQANQPPISLKFVIQLVGGVLFSITLLCMCCCLNFRDKRIPGYPGSGASIRGYRSDTIKRAQPA